MNKLALISVSDKNGIVEFAAGLKNLGCDILATGNTAKLIRENNIDCIEVSDFTGFPEIFSGRVKTLQPTIFGGILMRREDENDKNQAEENNVRPIDIVCVNLYPFPKVVNREDIDVETKIENIDIGGPSLIRAASKNFKYVSVLTNPGQYEEFLEEAKNGEISQTTREKLAAEAFAHTADYDKLIADYFEKEFLGGTKTLRISSPLQNTLRYGENPHQSAALYGNFYDLFDVLHGKELSYNNIVDLTAAVEIVEEFDPNSCVIIKHTNPCGSATGENIYDSYEKALSCDPVSSFGGIVAFNGTVDVKTSEKLNEIFLEIIVAYDFEPEAYEILLKKKNRRLLKFKGGLKSDELLIKNVPGGFVAQNKDNSKLTDDIIKTVTDRKASDAEFEDLKFAWKLSKHVKSNAIVLVKDRKGIGIGAGQMSRVDSSKIAVFKAKEHGFDLNGAVAASDAFFPFADGVEALASEGITAVIQPGGSVRDQEVIDSANKLNLAMLFTGIRNFKH